ncbi:MAG: radical SAM protein [Methanosarcinales archaeon]
MFKELIAKTDFPESIKKSMINSFEKRTSLYGNQIKFFTHPFTPISLTGTNCELNCKHCNSHYLEHMVDGSKNLYLVAKYLAKTKEGILLSGGCKADGSVPSYIFSEEIKKIKLDFNLKISAHTGIVNREIAKKLKDYGLDMALVDVIGSDETIKEIYGLNRTAEDYDNTLKVLKNANINLAPHIIVGLHNSTLKGELKALKMVKKYHPKVVVIVVFIPTKGTRGQSLNKPKIEDVISVITTARNLMDCPISLSCVRPGGYYRSMLDKYAILSGIDRIAVPSKSAYTICKKLGLEIEEKRRCCSY